MAARLQLALTEEQEKKLKIRAKNPPPQYVRSRVWALLLVAQGKPFDRVAQDHQVHRLLTEGI